MTGSQFISEQAARSLGQMAFDAGNRIDILNAVIADKDRLLAERQERIKELEARLSAAFAQANVE